MPDTTFGILDEIRYFLQQRLTAGLSRHAATAPARLAIELAVDPVLPLAALEDHEVLREPLAIVVEPLDLDRAAGAAARGQEAMTEGHRAGANLLNERPLRARRAIDRERHDPAAVEKQDPANRPSERQLAIAVIEHRVPVHRLGKRQLAQQAGEHVGQDVDRRFAANLFSERQIRALRRLEPLERRHFDVVLARESLRRPVWADRSRRTPPTPEARC